MSEKEEKITQIAEEISRCQKCPLYKNPLPVPGEGSSKAEVFFIGEAPGYWEAQAGRPFVGQAGKLLDKLIASLGLKREEVFISNVLHHRPPGNRDPSPEEIEACRGYAEKQIEIIQPKVLVTLGRFAMNIFLPEAKISRDHGLAKRQDKYLVFPVYHPAAALRSSSVYEELEKDFEKLGKLMRMEGEENKALVKPLKLEEESMPVPEQMSFFK